MLEFNINWPIFIIAALVNMILGHLWYAKSVFGSTWMKLSGLSEEKIKQNNMTKSMIGFVLSTLVMTYVLMSIIILFGSNTFSSGMLVGFWLWLGFVGTIGLGQVLWEDKSFKLYFINSGFYLVSLILMSGILAAWM